MSLPPNNVANEYDNYYKDFIGRENSFDMKNNYTGVGRLKFPNGDIYEGKFSHGQLQGQGQLTTNNGSVVYKGQFQNGFKHGVGQ